MLGNYKSVVSYIAPHKKAVRATEVIDFIQLGRLNSLTARALDVKSICFHPHVVVYCLTGSTSVREIVTRLLVPIVGAWRKKIDIFSSSMVGQFIKTE